MEKSYLSFKSPRNFLSPLEEFVKKNYPNSFESNLVRHLYVLDYICRGNYRHRKVVPIHMATLGLILGTNNSNTTKIINNLINLDMIKRVSKGISNKKSATYSLTSDETVINSLPYEVFSHKCIRNIITMKNKVSKNLSKSFTDSLEYENLAKYLFSITIDPTIISNIISHPLFPFSYLSPYDGQFEDEIGKNMIQEFKIEFQNIHSIYMKDIFIKRPDNKGRVYTPFSVMDRDHRPYLNYEGKVLKCLDISNSQPLIFCAFIKKYCEENNIELPEEEYNRYKKICEEGLFYEEFMEGDEFLEENRKDFKVSFFGSVFYTKISNIPYPLRRRFKNKFPKIYDLLDDVKSQHGNDGFARLMQEEEARIVWDCVNAPMLREGFQCYNIYDSIVSHDMDTIEEAKRRMVEEFGRLGISPKFKLEIFE